MPDQPRSRWLLWVVLGGGLFAILLTGILGIVVLSLHTRSDEGFSGFGDKIGVVDLDGIILSPKDVVEDLRKMEAEAAIREAGLLLIVFNESRDVLDKDLELFEDVLVRKEGDELRIVHVACSPFPGPPWRVSRAASCMSRARPSRFRGPIIVGDRRRSGPMSTMGRAYVSPAIQ